MYQYSFYNIQVTTLAGVFALALLIQPLVIPIAKNNMKQSENGKAVIIGYGWTWFVYQVTGIFGAVAICGIHQKEGTPGTTIFDYFPSDEPTVIVV